jgi:site-specific DNA-methyltransferase (adenine-specific)
VKARVPSETEASEQQLLRSARGEGWTLHEGDCIAGLRALPDLSCDVCITDPPYEAEAHENGKRQNPTSGAGHEENGKIYKRVVDDGIGFAAITEEQRLEAAKQIDRVCMRLALVFCQVEAVHLWRAAFETTDLVYRRTIPWVKPDAMPSLHGRWPGQAFEAVVLAIRSGETAPIGGKARYYTTTRERGLTRSHATAKPLALMRQIVEDFSNPNDLILDPFAGSGSTGVAANRLGRRFLGWELDANYFDIACRRLRGDEAKPRVEQPAFNFGAPT